MTKVRAFRFHDPISDAALTVCEEMRSVIDGFQLAPERSEAAAKLADKLLDGYHYSRISLSPAHRHISLREFERKFTDKGEIDGLNFLVTHFHKFVESFGMLDEKLEYAYKVIRPHQDPSYVDAEIQRPRAALDRLKRLVPEVTVAHIQLEKHFQAFTTASPSRQRMQHRELVDLFEPLQRLRDEYFRSPRADLLVEYLEVASTTTNHPQYYLGEYPRDKALYETHRAEVERITLELEVLIMLQTTEPEPAVPQVSA